MSSAGISRQESFGFLNSSVSGLIGVALPGVLFATAIVLSLNSGQLPRFSEFMKSPEFIVLTVAGNMAFIAGLSDWYYHARVLQKPICKKERELENLALWCAGMPLFFVTLHATITRLTPSHVLLMLALLVTGVAFVCYDEFIFHRKRCGRLETAFHRFLTHGMFIAWCSWIHWIAQKDLR